MISADSTYQSYSSH